MRQHTLAKLLLLPSLLSGLVVSLGAFVFLGYTTWLYINHNQLFYNSLFGPDGLQTYIGQEAQSLSGWQQFFMASQVSYYVLLCGLALLVGLAVFTILQILTAVVRESKEIVGEVLPDSQHSRSQRMDIAYKFVLRAFALVGWAIYIAFFVSSLMPFAVTLNQSGIDNLEAGRHSGVLLCVSAFVLLGLALHIHIIFMRLLLLRARVFGGDDDIIEAQAQPGHVA